MLQLTYISTATTGLDDRKMADILRVSRVNNHAAGVTGLLLHDGRRFLQALEGEAERVNATYRRVQADPRHRAVVLLSSREVATRAFGDWSMAAQQVAAGEGETLPELVDLLTTSIPDRTMQALFRSFARVRAAA